MVFRHPTPFGESDPVLLVNWNPVEPNMKKVNYLDITSRLEPKVNPETDRQLFWDEMYEKYNGKLLG